MKIRHYLYNAFIIENEKIKIAIDPGLNLLWYKLNSLIPKSEWKGVTHILVTHGDPDHFVYTVKMAKATKAPVICGKPLIEKGKLKNAESVQGIGVGEIIDLKDFQIEGIKTVHGPLVVKSFFGLLKYEYKPIKPRFMPGPGERIGLGAIGFKINIENKTIANLGDTLLQKEWEGLRPDVLMIPIGGRVVKNTMDEEEALDAIKLMSPRKVIPCHYNGDFFWIRNINPANADMFKSEVERMGIECIIMKYGDEVLV